MTTTEQNTREILEKLDDIRRLLEARLAAGEEIRLEPRRVTIHADAEEPEPPARGSRAGRLFGPRETWPTQGGDLPTDGGEAPVAAGTRTDTASASAADAPYWQRGLVKGFLLMRCAACGDVATYYLRTPRPDYDCRRCGHTNPVDREALRLVYCNCPNCGNSMRYKTNLTGPEAEVSCRNCGSPIDLTLNPRMTAYVTVRDRQRGRKGGETA